MRSRHLITAGCLLAAIALYAIGADSGAAFLVAGAVFEMAFWVRIGSRRKAR